MAPLRVGVLGAARIAPAAIVGPARRNPEVEVVAVAARHRGRAESFAAKHGIGRVVDSYEQLVSDPEVDAVYNPLPNGLHGRWTMAAVAAGKHVLCEKPFTANAEEAREVAAAAEGSGLVVMEAFHYRYHPLFARVLDLIATGAVGTVRHVEAQLCFPLLSAKDIRWDLALAGGATMDAGCYPIHMVRHLVGAEPSVTSARARLRSPGWTASWRPICASVTGPPAGSPAPCCRRSCCGWACRSAAMTARSGCSIRSLPTSSTG